MIRTLMVLLLAGGMLASHGQEKKPAAAKKTATKAKAASKPAADGIPPGAREIEPGTFRYVDAKGQAWIYQKTPFGMMKAPESKPQETDTVPNNWTVRDEGDSIAFERPYPFGGSLKWTKKKTEMNETEQAVWKRWQESKETAKQ